MASYDVASTIHQSLIDGAVLRRAADYVLSASAYEAAKDTYFPVFGIGPKLVHFSAQPETFWSFDSSTFQTNLRVLGRTLVHFSAQHETSHCLLTLRSHSAHLQKVLTLC